MLLNVVVCFVVFVFWLGVEVFDIYYYVEMLEGIDLFLCFVGVVFWVLVYIIDFCICGLIMLVLMFGLVFFGKFGVGFGLLLIFIMIWWYMVFFEVFNQGCLFGKQMMGLCVVYDDGILVGWVVLLLCNLLCFVDILFFGYVFGLFCCLNYLVFKCLGDIVVGILVVYCEFELSWFSLFDVEL